MRWCRRYRSEFCAWQLCDDKLLRRHEACAQQRQQQQEQGGLVPALHAGLAQAAHRNKRSGKNQMLAAHPALPVEPHLGGPSQVVLPSWRLLRDPSLLTFWPWVPATPHYQLLRRPIRQPKQPRQLPRGPRQNKHQSLEQSDRQDLRRCRESVSSWLPPCAPARLLARFHQRRPTARHCYRPGPFAGVRRSRACSKKATAATWRVVRSTMLPNSQSHYQRHRM